MVEDGLVIRLRGETWIYHSILGVVTYNLIRHLSTIADKWKCRLKSPHDARYADWPLSGTKKASADFIAV